MEKGQIPIFQNQYESYDLNMEYTDSTRIKKSDPLPDDETDEFEE